MYMPDAADSTALVDDAAVISFDYEELVDARVTKKASESSASTAPPAVSWAVVEPVDLSEYEILRYWLIVCHIVYNR